MRGVIIMRVSIRTEQYYRLKLSHYVCLNEIVKFECLGNSLFAVINSQSHGRRDMNHKPKITYYCPSSPLRIIAPM
jgi:hypothetical protein